MKWVKIKPVECDNLNRNIGEILVNLDHVAIVNATKLSQFQDCEIDIYFANGEKQHFAVTDDSYKELHKIIINSIDK